MYSCGMSPAGCLCKLKDECHSELNLGPKWKHPATIRLELSRLSSRVTKFQCSLYLSTSERWKDLLFHQMHFSTISIPGHRLGMAEYLKLLKSISSSAEALLGREKDLLMHEILSLPGLDLGRPACKASTFYPVQCFIPACPSTELMVLQYPF